MLSSPAQPTPDRYANAGRSAFAAAALPTRWLSAVQFGLCAALAYAAAMAVAGFVVLTVRIVVPALRPFDLAVGGLAAVLVLVLVWRFHRLLMTLAQGAIDATARFAEPRFFACALVIGVTLRLLCVLVFPASPVSDGATYVELASKLAAGQTFEVDGTRAYWPPGYPLFLAGWLAFIDLPRFAIVVSNLFLYILGALGVRQLALRVAGVDVARAAVLLHAVWPNLVLQAGLPEKELCLVALLPWVLAWSSLPSDGAARLSPGRLVAAGLLLGACTLVQPAVQLLPVVLALYWAAAGGKVWRAMAWALLIMGAAAAVVAPWTYRNFGIFDRFVLVSTNGGAGLFGSNNPQANGGYMERSLWPADLRAMPELEADREGKRRALAWIADNPGAFAKLAFERNLRFMGDDAVGAYQALKRGGGSASSITYAALKAISNLWWLAVWVCVLVALTTRIRHGHAIALHQWLVPAAFLYSFALHSIVESAGKYHVLWTGVLCVLVPMLVRSAPPSLPRSRFAAAV